MKICWAYLSLFLFNIALSGCNFFPYPTDLLRKPQENETIHAYPILSSFLTEDQKALVPQQGELTGAVNLIDLDHDRKNEIVAMIGSKDNIGLSLIILKQEKKQWKKVREIKEMDRDKVDFLQFRDVTGDDLPEIIYGTAHSSESAADQDKLLSIYQIHSGFRYTRLLQQPYQFIPAVTNLTGDKRAEIITFIQNKFKTGLNAQLFECHPSHCKRLSVLPLRDEVLAETNSFAFFDTIRQVKNGQVQKNRNGIIVELSAYSSIIYTSVLAVENKKLINLLAGKENAVLQYIFDDPLNLLQNSDKNRDGIIEINRTFPLSTDIMFSPSSMDGNILIHSQLNEKGRLMKVRQQYIHDKPDYIFEMPVAWDKNIQVKEINENLTQIFYLHKTQWILLYTIYDIPKNKWTMYTEKLHKNKETFFEIKKTPTKIYAVSFSKFSPNAPAKWKLSPSDMKQRIQIYGK